MPRQVPWSSWEEWSHVYLSLYSGDVSVVRKALLRVRAWELRKVKMPLAISATAQLMDIGLMDRVDMPMSMTLRLASSMAIIRLVNGLVDQHQHGTHARAVSHIARELGFPIWIVEVRHAATHAELPSSQILRRAAYQCIEWLRVWYWDQQAASVLRNAELANQSVSDPKWFNKVLERWSQCIFEPDKFSDVDNETKVLSVNSQNIPYPSSLCSVDDCVDALVAHLSEMKGKHSVVSNLVGSKGSHALLLDLGQTDENYDFGSSLMDNLESFGWNLWSERENIVAGFHDAWPSFVPSLFSSLCACVLDTSTIEARKASALCWVAYLCSKRWHALTVPEFGQVSENRNLSKIPMDDWTAKEKVWASSSVPLSTLVQSSIPINACALSCVRSGTQGATKLLEVLLPAFENEEDGRERAASLRELLSLRKNALSLGAHSAIEQVGLQNNTLVVSNHSKPSKIEDFETIVGFAKTNSTKQSNETKTVDRTNNFDSPWQIDSIGGAFKTQNIFRIGLSKQDHQNLAGEKSWTCPALRIASRSIQKNYQPPGTKENIEADDDFSIVTKKKNEEWVEKAEAMVDLL